MTEQVRFDVSKRRPRWQPPYTIPAEARERRCVWPRCPKTRYAGSPLCASHLEIAHSVWSIERAGKINPPIEIEASPLPAPKPVDGIVYFIRSGGYIKIGWTSNLDKRMKAYPPDTTLLAVMPGTRKDERAIHKRFAHLLTHGREWFPLAPQITEYIGQVTRQHGPPPTVDFAAKQATRIVGPRLDNYIGGVRGNELPLREVRG